MKKVLFLSVISFGFLILQGCTKNNDGAADNDQDPINPQADNKCRVVKKTRHNFSDHVFVYDNQGKIIRNYHSDYDTKFSHVNNSIIVNKTYNGNDFYDKIITLNEHGLPTNVRTDYPNNTWNNDAYEYNGKQLVKITHTRSGSISVNHTGFQWLNGNMIAETKSNGDITSYTFDLNEASQMGDYYNFRHLEAGFITVLNKNRVKSVTIPSGIAFNISHSEDADGKVKSYHVTATGGIDYTVNNIYECN